MELFHGKKKRAEQSEQDDLMNMRESLISIAAEAWRFRNVYQKMLSKLDVADANRFGNQYSWFEKKVEEAMNQSGISCKDLTGLPYDAGMAVTPMNLDDFEENDELLITRMIEPVIMAEGRIARTGVVMLSKIEE